MKKKIVRAFLLALAFLPIFTTLGRAAEKQEIMSLIYLGAGPEGTPPFNCLNNATTQSDGQFSQVITIASGTGETWEITANTSLYQVGGPVPPSAPVLIPLGTAFTESEDDPGIYHLSGLHVDGQGFNQLQFKAGDLPVPGTYYYRLHSGTFAKTKKMILMNR